MRIIATEVRASELRPGDLFSTAGPEYWQEVNERGETYGGVGERVYIRTNVPTPPEQANYFTYRITITPSLAELEAEIGSEPPSGEG